MVNPFSNVEVSEYGTGKREKGRNIYYVGLTITSWTPSTHANDESCRITYRGSSWNLQLVPNYNVNVITHDTDF